MKAFAIMTYFYNIYLTNKSWYILTQQQ